MAKKNGRRPKVDWSDKDILIEVESLARDGMDDCQIAQYFDLCPQTFSVHKAKFHELYEALKKGRRPLTKFVEDSLYRRAVGGFKVKTTVKRYLEVKCECDNDPNCEECYGTGIIVVTSKSIVTETEQELPPDTGAAALWLKQKKPDVWNKQPMRVDTTTNGNDINTIQVEVITRTDQIEKNSDD